MQSFKISQSWTLQTHAGAGDSFTPQDVVQGIWVLHQGNGILLLHWQPNLGFKPVPPRRHILTPDLLCIPFKSYTYVIKLMKITY